MVGPRFSPLPFTIFWVEARCSVGVGASSGFWGLFNFWPLHNWFEGPTLSCNRGLLIGIFFFFGVGVVSQLDVVERLKS